MTSKLVVNTIEADTGISSVSFASSISLSSTSKFFFSDAGINIGADTNISRAGNGILAFNINSSEKLRIDSKGQLSSSGSTIAFDGTGSLNGLQMYYETDSGLASFGSYSSGGNTDLSFYTNAGGGAATEKLRITSAGAVNIGDVPNNTWIDSTLKVRKDQNAVTKISVRNENQGSSASAAIVVNSYGNSWMFDCGSAAKNSNALTIRVDATASSNQGTERFRVTTDGKVKIGNSGGTPDGKLHIDEIGSGDIVAELTSGSPMFTYRNGSNAWFHAGKHPSDDAFVVTQGGTTTATELLRITSAGAVTKPSQPVFHAYGNNSWAQFTGSNNTLKLLNTEVNIGSHYKTSGSDDGNFVCPVAGTYFFYLTIYSGRTDNAQTDSSDYLAINLVSSVAGSLANKGGHHIAHYYNEADRDSTRTMSFIKTCAVGEKIFIRLNCNGTGFQVYGGHSGFGGYLIG